MALRAWDDTLTEAMSTYNKYTDDWPVADFLAYWDCYNESLEEYCEGYVRQYLEDTGEVLNEQDWYEVIADFILYLEDWMEANKPND